MYFQDIPIVFVWYPQQISKGLVIYVVSYNANNINAEDLNIAVDNDTLNLTGDMTVLGSFWTDAADGILAFNGSPGNIQGSLDRC